MRILIMGAGAFGTGLAIALASAGKQTTLWGRDAALIHEMGIKRENPRRLPGVGLPKTLSLTADLASVAKADMVLLAAPTQATRQLARLVAPHIGEGVPTIACAKGLELDSGLRQSEILSKSLPSCPIAVLSGPSLAPEIARARPTEAAIATKDGELSRVLSQILATGSLKLWPTDDVIGVEICGAVKNVLAIACGIVIGSDLGEGALASAITRGLSEMIRLGLAIGARSETFLGPAGIGDLILASTSVNSRNMAFGMELGRSLGRSDVAIGARRLPEGARTASMLVDLARANSVRLPIVETIAGLVAGAIPLSENIIPLS